MKTPVEFKREMLAIIDRYPSDKELLHIEMDALMCGVLNELGYGEGVDIFRNTKKWYA